MKGIVLAGGSGTRLHPLTRVISKQLLPLYDKPMVFYPLSVLMLGGIRQVLVISTSRDLPRFQELLGNGEHLGITVEYAVQDNPRGIADAFLVGERFIGADSVTLILGDNVFFGHELSDLMHDSVANNVGATVFAFHVNEPEHYGVVEFDDSGQVISIEEKPNKPRSNYAVVGLYVYDNDVISIARSLTPSARGEIEITDVNLAYLRRKQLNVRVMGRGFAWLDTGTHDSLADASIFVRTIQERQGLHIACLEETALNMGYIDIDKFEWLAERSSGSSYGDYLRDVARRYSRGNPGWM